MIGKLRGIVDTVTADGAVIDVGGVGYDVACSSRTLGKLPVGEPVTLFIETHVREDAIRLYGFLSEGERGWFRLLQSVQSVGAKVALAILSTLDTEALATAIALQDKAMVSRAPGVGPKVALRIVTELKDKAPVTGFAHGALAGSVAPSGEISEPPQSAARDAISALLNLGYPPAQASGAIAAAAANAGENARTEDLIRLGLKELAR